MSAPASQAGLPTPTTSAGTSGDVQAYVHGLDPHLSAIDDALDLFEVQTRRIAANIYLIRDPVWTQLTSVALSVLEQHGRSLQSQRRVPTGLAEFDQTLVSIGGDLVTMSREYRAGISALDDLRLMRSMESYVSVKLRTRRARAEVERWLLTGVAAPGPTTAPSSKPSQPTPGSVYVPPTPAPPTSLGRAYVLGSGGEEVRARHALNGTDTFGPWPDGTTVDLLGDQVARDGTGWRWVRFPDESLGYLEARHVTWTAPSEAVPAEPAATQVTVSRVVSVSGTDGEGVYLRRTPNLSDRLAAYPEGSRLEVISEEMASAGVTWLHVRTADEQAGYVPAQYTSAWPPTPAPKPQLPQAAQPPPASRSAQQAGPTAAPTPVRPSVPAGALSKPAPTAVPTRAVASPTPTVPDQVPYTYRAGPTPLGALANGGLRSPTFTLSGGSYTLNWSVTGQHTCQFNVGLQLAGERGGRTRTVVNRTINALGGNTIEGQAAFRVQAPGAYVLHVQTESCSGSMTIKR